MNAVTDRAQERGESVAHTSVKITANASDYREQMKSAATQMKELSSEYSLAATKAKLFGSAADTLKAKAESLTSKITVQKNIVQMNREQQERLTEQLGKQKTKQEELKTKVEAAKKAYEDEKKATGENSDSTKALKEELDKLEREFKENESAIGKTETALSKQTVSTNKSETALIEMEAELEKVNKELKNHKMDVFAEGCDKAGQKMEQFGKKMSAVSVGIAGLATASVKSYTEMKEGYDIIVTKTGATGDALDDLKSSADNVFGDMPEDMATVGEAVGEVNTRFHTTGTELEETSKLFIQFASINDTQVTQSVDQVDKIMKAWNIDASQTENLLGLLTQKAQDTGISVDSLESYVLDNNAAFKEMGLSLPQAINLMAQFDANGVDTTQALAGLKKALQNATAEGKSMDVALEETIGSIRDAKTDTEALQIATELFGKKGAAEMATAIRENRIDLTSLSASMSEYGSVVETTYSNTKSPMDEAKVAMNNVKLAMSEMGNTLLSSAAPAIGELTSKIKEVTQWFRSLDEGQQQTIIKVGMVVAAVGPLAIGFGKVAQGISSTIKTGQQFVSGASAIIAKITAKTAATAAGTTADTAATAATTAHTAATAAGATATGGMTAAQKALNLVMSMNPIMKVVTVVSLLVAGFVALYNHSEAFRNIVNKLWGTMKEVFGGIKNTIGNALGESKDVVIESLANMKAAYAEHGGGIKGVVAAGWEGIKGYYKAGFTFVDNLTGGRLTGLKNKFAEKMGAVKDTVKQKWDDIQTSYWEGGGGIAGIAEVIFDQQTESVRGAFDAMQSITGINMEGVRDKVVTVMQSVRNTVVDNLYNMQTAYAEHGGGINGIVAAGLEGIKGCYSSGLTFIDNLTGGKLTEIKSKFLDSEIGQSASKMFGTVEETAQRVMGATVETIKQNLLNMKTAYEENGGGINGIVAAGLEGIKGYYSTGLTFINNLTGRKLTDIKNKFSTNLNNAFSTVSSIVEKIRAKFNEKMEAAKSIVSGAIEKIKSFFSFKWKLPELELPHFNIEGKFSLSPPSVPKISIEWYRTGGIMTNPTVFGVNGTRLMVGGEAGAEAILPLGEFYTRLAAMLDSRMMAMETGSGTINMMIDQEKIIERLESIEKRIEKLKITEIIKLVPDNRRLFKVIRAEAAKEQEATGKKQFEKEE